MNIQCVLFDLDGTLLDTSFDFAYALNQTCQHFGQQILPYQTIRKVVSQGGQAMTELAFPDLSAEALETRKQYFLQIYHQHIAEHTALFPGLLSGMEALANKQIPWGIVTNKPAWLTKKLLSHLEFPSLPSSIISGDTLPQRKPDPAPMALAAKECRIAPEYCLYLGDHLRDIEAGKNAHMKTGAALYGYLPESTLENESKNWPADFFFHTPIEISHFLKAL